MAGINLKVQIEINGQFVQAGHITGSSFRDAAFSYDESYITSSAARAISLSLPLSKKAFDTDGTKSFFDGLLPEGFTRQCVADSIHASSDDYISILRQLLLLFCDRRVSFWTSFIFQNPGRHGLR